MNKRIVSTLAIGILVLPCLALAAIPQHDQFEHLGVQSCGASSCHGSASVRNTYSVLQNEYITWARHDMHSKSYKVLKNEQSQRIAKNLGLDAAHTAKICLDCHSDYVPRDRRGLQFKLSDGVACEACHGGAEQWLGIHISGGGDKHAESIAAGLYPTEDPEARAELCLSCHLGTKDKFATHEIMGAGHPRLSFDLQKFTDIQPRHYRVDDDYRERKDYVEDTRAWAIGQVKASRQYMTLLQGPRMAENGVFPELGLFDCHACHHAFKDLRWQANDRTATPPGSVLLNDSSLAMSQIIADVVQPGMSGALLNGIRQLHAASQTDVASIRTAAAALERQLAQLADTLRSQEFGRQKNNQLIKAMATAIRDERFTDYSDAEQATMAMDVFSGVTGSYKNELDAIYEVVADQEVESARRFDPQLFAAVFKGDSKMALSPSREPARQTSLPMATEPARVMQRPAPVRQAAAAGNPVRIAQAVPVSASGDSATMGAAMGGATHRINSAALRVRSEPRANARIRTALYRDELVEVTDSNGSWSRINYSDNGTVRTGWVASAYLAAVGDAVSRSPSAATNRSTPVATTQPTPAAAVVAMGTPNHRISSTALRVRARPMATAGVRTALYRGDLVEVVFSEGGWAKIKYSQNGEAQSGWVASQYLAPLDNAAAPQATLPVSQPAPAIAPEAAAPVTQSVTQIQNASHSVGANALRVRMTPEAAAGVRGILYFGDEVEFLSSVGEWSRINFSENGEIKRGWVVSSFLVPLD